MELLIASDAGLESWGFTNGNYARIGSFPVIQQPMTFEVAKMTDSGLADVVTLTGSGLSVYRIDAANAATQMSSVPVAGIATSKLVVGQLTGDVRSDVLLLSQNGITMFTGTANGTTLELPTPVTTPVTDAKIGDLDGDGDSDIVFVVQGVTGGPAGRLGVMLGDGTDAFSAPQITTLQELGGALELVDLDNDGRQDVIAVRTGTAAQRALLIYRGRSDGGLEPPVAISLPGSSAKISARGSFNGNLVPDIVVTDSPSASVYVFPSNP